jgi:uncharacterized membrane protein
MITGFFTPRSPLLKAPHYPGRFQTARIGARSRRRSHPLILEKKLAFVPAMEVSRRVITRNWWRMLLLMLAAALFSLMGIAALFIGIILTLPISLCVLTCAYDSLFNPKSSLPVQPAVL